MTSLKVYEDLVSGKLSISDAIEFLNSKDIRKTINGYVNAGFIPSTESDMQTLNGIVLISQYLYNNTDSEEIMSDTNYDILYELMLEYGGSDIASAPLKKNKYIKIAYHKFPQLRGSMSKFYYLGVDEEDNAKVKSRKSLDEVLASKERDIFTKTGKDIDLNNTEIYLFPKYDGVSGVFEFDKHGKLERVLTRGYTQTNEAEDITHLFPKFKYPKPKWIKGPYGLKTEIMMKNENLDEYNEMFGTDYKNSRSIVASFVNSDEYNPDKAEFIEVVPLRVGDLEGNQWLTEDVYDHPKTLRARFADREIIWKYANETRFVDGLRTDGVVLYIIDEGLQNVLGRDNDINNYEVAYKFTEEKGDTTVIDIIWQIGKFGRITPVAVVEPIKLKGNTIERISLGSIGRAKELELQRGDSVTIIYDIIPYLILKEHLDGENIEIPDICPECGAELQYSESGEIAFCNNPECPAVQKGKILNYLNKMDIDDISYASIDKLFKAGIVKSIIDIYKLEDRMDEIMEIEGIGPKTLLLWINNIKQHSEVYDYKLLGALGIESVSAKKFRKITEIYDIYEILDISKNRDFDALQKINGIGPKIAEAIIYGIADNKALIKKLLKFITVIDYSDFAGNPSFKVVFTKIRDKDAEKLIESRGGVVEESLTKDVDLLIVPNMETKSSKINKAKKYGIEIIPLDQLENWCINHHPYR